MLIRKDELLSFYTHLFGVFLSFVGTLLLIYNTNGIQSKITASIYGFSLIFLFTASSTYHAFKKKENETSIWRKLDHLAIYIMIAGTYTPICFIYLDGVWRWGVIIFQWTLVVAGFFIKFYFLNSSRLLSTALYVLMGWVAVVPLHKLLKSMPAFELFLMFGGGIVFTFGALLYAIKRPNFPKLDIRFGFHEIFHLLILLGGAMHFVMIYMAFGL